MAVSDRCCCGILHIKYASIAVGSCSLLSTSLNAFLSCLGINRTSHHFFVEFCLILIDIIAVLLLFYGVQNMRPNFLKPYVYANLAWCLALILLFILSLTQLINGDELSRKIADSLADIFNLTQPTDNFQNAGALVTAFSLFGLLLTILVNVWFLYVIFKCYQWMIVELETPPLLRKRDNNATLQTDRRHN